MLGFNALEATLHCAIVDPYEPREKEGRRNLNIFLSLTSERPVTWISTYGISQNGKPFNSWAAPVYDVVFPVKAVDCRSPNWSVTPVSPADPDPLRPDMFPACLKGSRRHNLRVFHAVIDDWK